MNALPKIEFWFDFASTYSYPAAMRVEELAGSHGCSVQWRPFLLGAIFQKQGWNDSPFNIYPAKGRYMWRDLERLCASLELPFRKPSQFRAMVWRRRASPAPMRVPRGLRSLCVGCTKPISRTTWTSHNRAFCSNPGVRRGATADAAQRRVELGIFGAPMTVVGKNYSGATIGSRLR